MANSEQFSRMQILRTEYNFGDTDMYVRALLKWRDEEVSGKPQAPVDVHLHVSDFYKLPHGRQGQVCAPEFKVFSLYLGHLVDPQAVNDMIPEILSHVRCNDPSIVWFWEEELTDFAGTVGQEALDTGVEEMELTVEIHIHNMACQRLLEKKEGIIELVRYIFDERI